MFGLRRNLLCALCAAVALLGVTQANDNSTLFLMMDPTTAIVTQTPTITVTPTASVTVVGGASGKSSDDGLSGGAIAGITVGAVAVVATLAVTIIVIGYFIWKQKAVGKVIPTKEDNSKS